MANPLPPALNEALRRAAFRDGNQDRFLGIPQPEDPGELRDDLKGFLRRLGPVDVDPTRPELAPRRPRFLSYQSDALAGVGATVDRFSLTINRQLLLNEIVFNLSNADPSSSHILPLLRRGDDTTAGITDDDLELWNFPEPIAGVGGVISAAASSGEFSVQVNQPLLDPPYRFHTMYINAAGAVPLHANVVYATRIIEPEEAEQFSPAPLIRASVFGTARAHPLPPRRRLAAGAAPPAPPIMQVCGPGFCRNIPWVFLAPELKREFIVNQLNGVPTPGMTPVQ